MTRKKGKVKEIKIKRKRKKNHLKDRETKRKMLKNKKDTDWTRKRNIKRKKETENTCWQTEKERERKIKWHADKHTDKVKEKHRHYKFATYREIKGKK